MAKKYYAVSNGRSTGVFNDWSSCKSSVNGFSGATFKGFDSLAEARSFASGNSGNSENCGNIGSSGSSGSSYSGRKYSRCSNYGGSYSKSYIKSKPIVKSAVGSGRVTKQQVFVDGAARGNGRVGAKAGYGVYWGENDSRNEHDKLEGAVQTNQRAELTALKKATDRIADEVSAGKGSSYEVKTDSQYSKKAVTEWHTNWEKNGWQTSPGKPVANVDIIKPILSNIKRIRSNGGDISITHVPGHSGVEGNERADQLANLGADKHDK